MSPGARLAAPKDVKGRLGGPGGADRVRVPYGFATDRWADLGNLSVYRHDNGADAYELFNFFVTQQEVNHIFDNYRRGRQAFSVRAASKRTLNRYNAKMRDGAKGLGLIMNIYREFALDRGYDFDTFWVQAANSLFKENTLAAGIAFDHFSLQMARPQPGEHFLPDGDTVLRSSSDVFGDPGNRWWSSRTARRAISATSPSGASRSRTRSRRTRASTTRRTR